MHLRQRALLDMKANKSLLYLKILPYILRKEEIVMFLKQ